MSAHRLVAQKGEIATILTLVGMGVMLLGAMVESWAIKTNQRQTTQPKAFGYLQGSPTLGTYNPTDNKVAISGTACYTDYLASGSETVQVWFTGNDVATFEPASRNYSGTNGFELTCAHDNAAMSLASTVTMSSAWKAQGCRATNIEVHVQSNRRGRNDFTLPLNTSCPSPTPTATPVPPTSTPTLGPAAPTATPTTTPVPGVPTSTPTSTPVAGVPTATPTVVPGGVTSTPTRTPTPTVIRTPTPTGPRPTTAAGQACNPFELEVLRANESGAFERVPDGSTVSIGTLPNGQIVNVQGGIARISNAVVGNQYEVQTTVPRPGGGQHEQFPQQRITINSSCRGQINIAGNICRSFNLNVYYQHSVEGRMPAPYNSQVRIGSGNETVTTYAGLAVFSNTPLTIGQQYNATVSQVFGQSYTKPFTLPLSCRADIDLGLVSPPVCSTFTLNLTQNKVGGGTENVPNGTRVSVSMSGNPPSGTTTNGSVTFSTSAATSSQFIQGNQYAITVERTTGQRHLRYMLVDASCQRSMNIDETGPAPQGIGVAAGEDLNSDSTTNALDWSYALSNFGREVSINGTTYFVTSETLARILAAYQ